MRLSDIMSQLGLTFYPQVALIIFLGVFIAVAIRTFRKSRKSDLESMASMPLDDAPTPASSPYAKVAGIASMKEGTR